MPLAVLGLDLATRTGWAVLDRHGQLTSGVVSFDLARGESPGMRFLRARRWLEEVLVRRRVEIVEAGLGVTAERVFNEPAVDVVAFEQGSHHRGGAATQVLVGLQAIALAQAAVLGIETLPVHTTRLKKWAAGRGNATKEEMVAAARARWPDQDVVDDNQADALWVLAFACAEIGVRA